MMRLYIDKENLESLVQGRKKHLALYDELIRAVKKGLGVYYNFNFSEEAFLKNQYLQAWFNAVKGDGVKTESEAFCPPHNVFPERPIKTNFLSTCNPDEYRSLYFLCMEDNIAKAIQNTHCILIGNVGEEYDIIDKLVSLEDKEILTKNIASWNSYCPKLPLTDIVLCDEHYFKDKMVYDKNNNEILTSLCQTPNSQINVVIITKEGEIDPSLGEECKAIKEHISKVSGISKGKCNVTVMTTNRTHSRHLITNYFRIVHTSCFHLIDNGLKDDVNTDIAPCIKQNANEITDNLLALFQSVATAPVQCFGDKKSNFLNFPKDIQKG